MIANTTAKPSAPPSFRTGDERLIKLSEAAGNKVKTLLTRQGRPAGVLRVAVVGGGCSGLQYKMDLQDGPASRDILVETSGVRVVVDPKSALYVPAVNWISSKLSMEVSKSKIPMRRRLFLWREFYRLKEPDDGLLSRSWMSPAAPGSTRVP